MGKVRNEWKKQDTQSIWYKQPTSEEELAKKAEDIEWSLKKKEGETAWRNQGRGGRRFLRSTSADTEKSVHRIDRTDFS